MNNFIAKILETSLSKPAHIAITGPDFKISYGELQSLIQGCMQFLLKNGVRSGEVIALRLENELLYLLAILASLGLGASIFSLSKDGEITSIKSDIDKLNIHYLITDINDSKAVELFKIYLRMEDVKKFSGENLELFSCQKNHPAIIFSGSGSTGKPKVICLTHHHLFQRMLSNGNSMGVDETDKVATMSLLDFPTPKQRYLEALAEGATIVILDRNRVMESISEQGVTILHATPMHAELMCSTFSQPALHLFKKLRALYLATATVRQSLRIKLSKIITPNIFIRYSTNETSLISSTNPANLFLEGSVGSLEENVELKILDASGSPVNLGEVGSIYVKTPGMVSGYVSELEANSNFFVDGWFITGDLGKLMPDGTLIHCGRSDNMMIFNGVNVSPIQIENCALNHDEVADVAVFPALHSVHQQVPVCVIQFKSDSKCSVDDIEDYFRHHLGIYAPKIVLVVERIPRNQNGKLVKADLIDVLNKWFDKN